DIIEHTFKHIVTSADLGTGSIDITLSLEEGLSFAEGETKVDAIITDKAGNSSSKSDEVKFEIDTSGPGGEAGTDKPTVTIEEATNGINKEELSNGIQVKVTLTDSTQVDDTVVITLTDANGIKHTFEHRVTSVDLETGSIDITLSLEEGLNFAEGETKVDAIITDKAGNSSGKSDEVKFEIDTIAPEAPDKLKLDQASEVLTGTAEAGSTITVIDKDNNVIGTATVKEDGTFEVALNPSVAENDTVNVTATDEAGNTSYPNRVVHDTTPPDGSTTSIQIDEITSDGILNKIESEAKVTITGTVKGEFTVGDTIKIFVNGKELEGKVGANGQFTFEVEGSDLLQDSDKQIDITVE